MQDVQMGIVDVDVDDEAADPSRRFSLFDALP